MPFRRACFLGCARFFVRACRQARLLGSPAFSSKHPGLAPVRAGRRAQKSPAAWSRGFWSDGVLSLRPAGMAGGGPAAGRPDRRLRSVSRGPERWRSVRARRGADHGRPGPSAWGTHRGRPVTCRRRTHHGRLRPSGFSRSDGGRSVHARRGAHHGRLGSARSSGHDDRRFSGRRRPVRRRPEPRRRQPVRRRKNRRRRRAVRRTHNHRGRQHGKEQGCAEVSRRIISSRADTDADASCIHARRIEGHVSRNVRPVGVVGAAAQGKGKDGSGKKPELHGRTP